MDVLNLGPNDFHGVSGLYLLTNGLSSWGPHMDLHSTRKNVCTKTFLMQEVQGSFLILGRLELMLRRLDLMLCRLELIRSALLMLHGDLTIDNPNKSGPDLEKLGIV